MRLKRLSGLFLGSRSSPEGEDEGRQVVGAFDSQTRLMKASNRTRGASVVTVVILLSSSLLSQTVPERTPATRRAATPSRPFDADVNSLPSPFAGHDAVVIYDLIDAKLSGVTKSEFETEAEYLRRTGEPSQRTISGSTKVGDLFAFSLTGSAWTETFSDDLMQSMGQNLQTAYNAQTQTLTVTVPDALVDGTLAEDSGWRSFWRRSRRYLGEYVGSNAFGVRQRVTRWALDEMVLVVHHGLPGTRLSEQRGVSADDWLYPDCDKRDLGQSLSCSITLGAQAARNLSGNLVAVIVARPIAPFVSFESDTNTPTINAPGEIQTRTKFLHVRLEQLWLADRRTGQVLRKYSRERHDAAYPSRNIGTTDARAEPAARDRIRAASTAPPALVLPLNPFAPQAKPLRVGNDIKAPMQIKRVEPIYSQIAQSARIQGVVILEATIGVDGKVKDVKVLRSIPLLDQAAIDAVRQWEYTPTLVNNMPTPVIMTVTVTFTLSEASRPAN
jgi:TonB family protein